MMCMCDTIRWFFVFWILLMSCSALSEDYKPHLRPISPRRPPHHPYPGAPHMGKTMTIRRPLTDRGPPRIEKRIEIINFFILFFICIFMGPKIPGGAPALTLSSHWRHCLVSIPWVTLHNLLTLTLRNLTWNCTAPVVIGRISKITFYKYNIVFSPHLHLVLIILYPRRRSCEWLRTLWNPHTYKCGWCSQVCII